MRDLNPIIQELLPDIIAFRHELHQHPELSMQEFETVKRVVAQLEGLPGLVVTSGVAETGVVALLDGDKPGPCLALRADMDALPIQEETGKSYRSKFDGRMHACGHDGHTASLVGAVKVLCQLRDELTGPVKFIFQPGEEGYFGAKKMCAEGVLKNPDVAAVFGLHGWPGLKVGTVGVGSGPVMASNDTFYIDVTGKGCHAALPHCGIDPVLVAAHIVVALQSIASRSIDPLEGFVLTVGKIEGGMTDNIIPERASLLGTIRTLNERVRGATFKRIEELVSHTARAFGAEAQVRIEEGYPVVVNDQAATDFVATVLHEIVGEACVSSTTFPMMAAEDFSYYGQEVPASFWMLGLCPEEQAEYPACHSPKFDFTDDSVPIAIKAHCEMARRFASTWARWFF